MKALNLGLTMTESLGGLRLEGFKYDSLSSMTNATKEAEQRAQLNLKPRL
jgi:hypothetical protein